LAALKPVDWHGACIRNPHVAANAGISEDKVQTLELKQILDAKQVLGMKMSELSSAKTRREDIAIEKTSEEMDAIQQSADRILALDSMTRRWETQTLVSEALQRIENNTYGICSDCEEAISPKRLAALPWAKFCIACQDARDTATAEMRWTDAA